MESFDIEKAIAIMEEEMSQDMGTWEVTHVGANGFFYTRETDYSLYYGICEITGEGRVFAEIKVASK